MEELSELLLQRRRKVDALWEAGVNPYPNDFKPLHTSAEVIAAYGDKEQFDAGNEQYVVAGRILARRSFGKAAFIQLQDRKGRIQVYVKKDDIGAEAFEAFESIDIGDIVGVEGFPFRTKTGELSLQMQSRYAFWSNRCTPCRRNSTASPIWRPDTASGMWTGPRNPESWDA